MAARRSRHRNALIRVGQSKIATCRGLYLIPNKCPGLERVLTPFHPVGGLVVPFDFGEWPFKRQPT
jgi:hypothetical protein